MLKRILGGIFALVVFLVVINVDLNICGAQQENPEKYKEDKTGMIITKEIQGDVYDRKLVYHIKTPIIDYFDFVLAVDNSGSIGQGDRIEGYAIENAVPRFIKGILENETKITYANYNVSVVSWNDNVTIAPLDNGKKDSSKASFFAINESTSAEHINVINKKFKSFYDYSDETSGTNINTAIKGCEAILDADKEANKKYINTKKFIILVVGNGEYKPCNSNLITKVNAKYPIYTIGMDISEKTTLFDHVKNLTMNKEYHWKHISAGESALRKELDKSLETALWDILHNATRGPVANDVKIVESLYCYYKPDMNSFALNGEKTNIAKSPKTNLDGSTTIIFDVPEAYLKPNSETVASFNAKFVPPYLPTTVTNNKEAIELCAPVDSDTQLSTLFYKWFNGDDLKILMT